MAKLLIKKMLKKKGMTKYQLADRMEISYKRVFKYFQSKYKNPTLRTLERLALGFGCKIKDLFEDIK